MDEKDADLFRVVADDLNRNGTVVWENSWMSLDAAIRNFDTNEAQQFISACFGKVVTIMLDQHPSKIGHREKDCVTKCLLAATKLSLMLLEQGRLEFVSTLFMLLDRRKTFYSELRPSGRVVGAYWNRLVGAPEVRAHCIRTFCEGDGFDKVLELLENEDTSGGASPFDSYQLEDYWTILQSLLEGFACVDNETIRRTCTYILRGLSLKSSEKLKQESTEIFGLVLSTVHKLLTRCGGEIAELYKHWLALTLKYVTSPSLPQRLFGYEQVTALVSLAEEHPRIPIQYIVQDAGIEAITGVYELVREDPSSIKYSMQKDDQPQLTLFQCSVRSGNEKMWFISKADEDQPGTDQDIDYYQSSGGNLPPEAGWEVSRGSRGPPPTLTPVWDGSEETLSTRLIDWVRENNILHEIFGSRVHREVISRSSDLLRFLCESDALLEEDLKLMWKAAESCKDEFLVKELHTVIADVALLLSPPLMIYLLGLLRSAITENDSFPEVLTFIESMIDKAGDSGAALRDREDDVLFTVLELLWDIQKHPRFLRDSSPSLTAFFTISLNSKRGSVERIHFLEECVQMIQYSYRFLTGEERTSLPESSCRPHRMDGEINGDRESKSSGPTANATSSEKEGWGRVSGLKSAWAEKAHRLRERAWSWTKPRHGEQNRESSKDASSAVRRQSKQESSLLGGGGSASREKAEAADRFSNLGFSGASLRNKREVEKITHRAFELMTMIIANSPERAYPTDREEGRDIDQQVESEGRATRARRSRPSSRSRESRSRRGSSGKDSRSRSSSLDGGDDPEVYSDEYREEELKDANLDGSPDRRGQPGALQFGRVSRGESSRERRGPREEEEDRGENSDEKSSNRSAQHRHRHAPPQSIRVAGAGSAEGGRGRKGHGHSPTVKQAGKVDDLGLPQLNRKYDLEGLLFKELKAFTRSRPARTKSSSDYASSIRCRLGIIRHVYMRLPDATLTEKQLEDLWVTLADVHERELFLVFLSSAGVRSSTLDAALDLSVCFYVFGELFCRRTDFSTLTVLGFKSFHTYFVGLNYSRDVLEKGPDGSMHLIRSLDLLGLDALWKIALESPCAVSETASATLLSVYKDLAQPSRETHYDFLTRAFSYLEQVSMGEDPTRASPQSGEAETGTSFLAKESSTRAKKNKNRVGRGSLQMGGNGEECIRKIQRCLRLLSGFVRNCSGKMSAVHCQPFTEKSSQNLVVLNVHCIREDIGYYESSKTEGAGKFSRREFKVKLKLLRSARICDVTAELVRKTGQDPSSIVLALDNKVVSQLESSLPLSARDITSSSRAVAHFTQWKPRAGVGGGHAGPLLGTRPATNGSTIHSQNVDRLGLSLLSEEELLEEDSEEDAGDTDVDDSEEESDRGLFSSGYAQHREFGLSGTECETPHAGDVLVEKDEFFEILFHILDQVSDRETQTQIWNLLLSVPTDRQLFKGVVEAGSAGSDSDPGSSWRQLLQVSSRSKVIYTLQIVDSLLAAFRRLLPHSGEWSPDASKIEIYDTQVNLQDFQARFATLGGLGYALKYLLGSCGAAAVTAEDAAGLAPQLSESLSALDDRGAEDLSRKMVEVSMAENTNRPPQTAPREAQSSELGASTGARRQESSSEPSSVPPSSPATSRVGGGAKLHFGRDAASQEQGSDFAVALRIVKHYFVYSRALEMMPSLASIGSGTGEGLRAVDPGDGDDGEDAADSSTCFVFGERVPAKALLHRLAHLCLHELQAQSSGGGADKTSVATILDALKVMRSLLKKCPAAVDALLQMPQLAELTIDCLAEHEAPKVRDSALVLFGRVARIEAGKHQPRHSEAATKTERGSDEADTGGRDGPCPAEEEDGVVERKNEAASTTVFDLLLQHVGLLHTVGQRGKQYQTLLECIVSDRMVGSRRLLLLALLVLQSLLQVDEEQAEAGSGVSPVVSGGGVGCPPARGAGLGPPASSSCPLSRKTSSKSARRGVAGRSLTGGRSAPSKDKGNPPVSASGLSAHRLLGNSGALSPALRLRGDGRSGPWRASHKEDAIASYLRLFSRIVAVDAWVRAQVAAPALPLVLHRLLLPLPSLSDKAAWPVCSSPAGRQMGFRLLETLARSNEETMRVLSRRMTLFLEAAAAPLRDQWMYESDYETWGRTAYVGLKNQGCTCYMNAFMQQLFMVTETREGIMKAKVSQRREATPVHASAGHAESAVFLEPGHTFRSRPLALIGRRIRLLVSGRENAEAVVRSFHASTGKFMIALLDGQGTELLLPLFEGWRGAEEALFLVYPVRPASARGGKDAEGPHGSSLVLGESPTASNGGPEAVDPASAPAPARAPGPSASPSAPVSTDPSIEVLQEVQRTFWHLAEGTAKYFNTARLVEVCKHLNLEFSVYQQNDASEFCDKLLDRLELGLKKVGEGAACLERAFGGRTISQKIPQGCGHRYEREEPFIRIELLIRGKESIEESLDAFVEGELMDGDNKVECELCGTKKAAVRRTCLGTLPNLLVLHLKRFDLDFSTFETVKLNSRCSFPLRLNVKPYTSVGIEEAELKTRAGSVSLERSETKPSAAAEEEDEDEEVVEGEEENEEQDTSTVAEEHDHSHDKSEEQARMTRAVNEEAPGEREGFSTHSEADTEHEHEHEHGYEHEHEHEHESESASSALLDEGYMYSLAGVLVHSGVAQGGHYYSFIRDRRSGVWYRFDDEDVTEFDPANIELECFGGVQKRPATWRGSSAVGGMEVETEMYNNALMLFYEKEVPVTVGGAEGPAAHLAPEAIRNANEAAEEDAKARARGNAVNDSAKAVFVGEEGKDEIGRVADEQEYGDDEDDEDEDDEDEDADWEDEEGSDLDSEETRSGAGHLGTGESMCDEPGRGSNGRSRRTKTRRKRKRQETAVESELVGDSALPSYPVTSEEGALAGRATDEQNLATQLQSGNVDGASSANALLSKSIPDSSASASSALPSSSSSSSSPSSCPTANSITSTATTSPTLSPSFPSFKVRGCPEESAALQSECGLLEAGAGEEAVAAMTQSLLQSLLAHGADAESALKGTFDFQSSTARPVATGSSFEEEVYQDNLSFMRNLYLCDEELHTFMFRLVSNDSVSDRCLSPQAATYKCLYSSSSSFSPSSHSSTSPSSGSSTSTTNQFAEATQGQARETRGGGAGKLCGVLQLCTRFFLDVVLHLSKRRDLQQWYHQLQARYLQCPEASRWLIHRATHAGATDWLGRTLLLSPDRVARQVLQRLLADVLAFVAADLDLDRGGAEASLSLTQFSGPGLATCERRGDERGRLLASHTQTEPGREGPRRGKGLEDRRAEELSDGQQGQRERRGETLESQSADSVVSPPSGGDRRALSSSGFASERAGAASDASAGPSSGAVEALGLLERFCDSLLRVVDDDLVVSSSRRSGMPMLPYSVEFFGLLRAVAETHPLLRAFFRRKEAVGRLGSCVLGDKAPDEVSSAFPFARVGHDSLQRCSEVPLGEVLAVLEEVVGLSSPFCPTLLTENPYARSRMLRQQRQPHQAASAYDLTYSGPFRYHRLSRKVFKVLARMFANVMLHRDNSLVGREEETQFMMDVYEQRESGETSRTGFCAETQSSSPSGALTALGVWRLYRSVCGYDSISAGVRARALLNSAQQQSDSSLSGSSSPSMMTKSDSALSKTPIMAQRMPVVTFHQYCKYYYDCAARGGAEVWEDLAGFLTGSVAAPGDGSEVLVESERGREQSVSAEAVDGQSGGFTPTTTTGEEQGRNASPAAGDGSQTQAKPSELKANVVARVLAEDPHFLSVSQLPQVSQAVLRAPEFLDLVYDCSEEFGGLLVYACAGDAETSSALLEVFLRLVYGSTDRKREVLDRSEEHSALSPTSSPQSPSSPSSSSSWNASAAAAANTLAVEPGGESTHVHRMRMHFLTQLLLQPEPSDTRRLVDMAMLGESGLLAKALELKDTLKRAARPGQVGAVLFRVIRYVVELREAVPEVCEMLERRKEDWEWMCQWLEGYSLDASLGGVKVHLRRAPLVESILLKLEHIHGVERKPEEIGFVVEGAGTPSVNGFYRAGDKTWDGLPRYALTTGDTEYTLFRCRLRNGRRWYISVLPTDHQPGTDKDVDFYSIASDADAPPQSGWKVANSASAAPVAANPPPIVRMIVLRGSGTEQRYESSDSDGIGESRYSGAGFKDDSDLDEEEESEVEEPSYAASEGDDSGDEEVVFEEDDYFASNPLDDAPRRRDFGATDTGELPRGDLPRKTEDDATETSLGGDEGGESPSFGGESYFV